MAFVVFLQYYVYDESSISMIIQLHFFGKNFV